MSMSAVGVIILAVTARGESPLRALRYSVLVSDPCLRSAIDLMLRMMSVTSSRTPGSEENSCCTSRM